MARFGANILPPRCWSRALVYGGNGKILSPEKTVLMPTLNAECSSTSVAR
ncbi:hypothetical protein ACNKHO_03650 [Shigella flexneri]